MLETWSTAAVALFPTHAAVKERPLAYPISAHALFASALLQAKRSQRVSRAEGAGEGRTTRHTTQHLPVFTLRELSHHTHCCYTHSYTRIQLQEDEDERIASQEKPFFFFFPENIICPEVFYFCKWHAKMLKQPDQLESNYFFTAVS